MGIADPSAMPSSTYVLLSLGLLASICLATDSYAPETEFVQEFRGRWSHDENQLERSAARMFRPDPRSEIGRPEMAAERTRMNVGSRSMVGEGSQATGPRGAKAAAEAAAALYHGRAHKVRVKVGGAVPDEENTRVRHGQHATIDHGAYRVVTAKDKKDLANGNDKYKVKIVGGRADKYKRRDVYGVKMMGTGVNERAEAKAKERAKKEHEKIEKAKRRARRAEEELRRLEKEMKKVKVEEKSAMERADKHERKLKDANKRSAEREKKVKKNEKLLKEHAVKRKRRLEKQLKAARADEKKEKREMEIDRKKDAKERRRKMAERAAARERRMKREARMKKEAAHERRLKALARAQGQKRVYNVKVFGKGGKAKSHTVKHRRHRRKGRRGHRGHHVSHGGHGTRVKILKHGK